MVTYEPELMFAYDTKNEYADLKNVYNVTGDDICYCPICLGRVKLWNGQDPNRTYLKQRCFHHIDGMCSQESRIHFAYKTWLLKENSKFKVGDDLYEVKSVKLEKTLKTIYGNYRPDIIVETVNGKTFYVEIADTNKKTDEYVLKWDELSNDVIEIDVNEQLSSIATKDIPVFNLIYSAETGQCLIKRYVRQDYDEIFTERKLYWKRQDLLNYKIKWERLDWFWLILQEYYAGKKTVEDVCNSFEDVDFEDQKFICSRFKSGKHKQIKYELENHYSDEKELKKVKLQHVSNVVRTLNKEFGYSSTNSIEDTYLFRKNRHVIFKDSCYWEYRSHLYIDDNTNEDDVYKYFYPIMSEYYKSHTLPLREKRREEFIQREERRKFEEKIRENLISTLEHIKNKINTSQNKMWLFDYYFKENKNSSYCILVVRLAETWKDKISLAINFDKNDVNEEYLKEKILCVMNKILTEAKRGNSFCRIMELEEK